MTTVWARLTRCGGVEENFAIPTVVLLTEGETFVGRVARPPTPAAGDTIQFTHESQFVIPCLFVSSTHFGVTIDVSSGERKCTLRDYSRNGTFHNRQLVGTQIAQLREGDEISLVYKSVEKIVYRFSFLEATASLAAGRAAPSQSVEVANDIFAVQIAALQQETLHLEKRLQGQVEHIDGLTADLEAAHRKSRSDEKSLASAQAELEEWRERARVAEANASAAMARATILEDEMTGEREKAQSLRAKLVQQADELRDKTASFESKMQVINDSNKALAHEQAQRAKTEKLLEAERDTSRRMAAANQALQGIVSDTEHQVATAQSRLRGFETLRLKGLVQLQEQQAQLDVYTSTLLQLRDQVQVALAARESLVGTSASLQALLEGHHREHTTATYHSDSAEDISPQHESVDPFQSTQVPPDVDGDETGRSLPSSQQLDVDRSEGFISQDSRVRYDSSATTATSANSGPLCTQQSPIRSPGRPRGAQAALEMSEELPYWTDASGADTPLGSPALSPNKRQMDQEPGEGGLTVPPLKRHRESLPDVSTPASSPSPGPNPCSAPEGPRNCSPLHSQQATSSVASPHTPRGDGTDLFDEQEQDEQERQPSLLSERGAMDAE